MFSVLYSVRDGGWGLCWLTPRIQDFLQMGYIETKPNERFTLVAKKDLQIYAAFAIPLLSVIMGIYCVLEVYSQRRFREYVKKQKGRPQETV
jgi:hypothetical protein